MKKTLKISALILAGILLLAVFVGLISLYVSGVPALFSGSGGSTTSSKPTTAATEPSSGTTVDTEPSTVPPETEPPATTIPETDPPPTTIPETDPPPTTIPETEPPATTAPPKTYQLDSKVTFVYDLTNGDLLQIKGDLDKRVYPASITKLFNAYIALQYLEPTQEITVGQELTLLEEDASDAGLKEGYVLTVEQLLKAMLLPSGCDAACILAVNAGRAIAQDPELDYQEAYELYIEQMNIQLQVLGLTGTHFTNPYGYHAKEHYTTPRDLIAMAALCLDNPYITACTSTYKADVTIVSGETFQWKNTNYVINPYSRFYVKYALGLKTGSTSDAGACLLTAYRKNGRVFIIGTMGGSYFNSRYDDSAYLYKTYCK